MKKLFIINALIMVWGAILFNDDNTDISFDLTCPLISVLNYIKGQVRSKEIFKNLINSKCCFLNNFYSHAIVEIYHENIYKRRNNSEKVKSCISFS